MSKWKWLWKYRLVSRQSVTLTVKFHLLNYKTTIQCIHYCKADSSHIYIAASLALAMLGKWDWIDWIHEWNAKIYLSLLNRHSVDTKIDRWSYTFSDTFVICCSMSKCDQCGQLYRINCGFNPLKGVTCLPTHKKSAPNSIQYIDFKGCIQFLRWWVYICVILKEKDIYHQN